MEFLSLFGLWRSIFLLECSNWTSSVNFSLVRIEQLLPMECYLLQMFLHRMPLLLFLPWDLITTDTDLSLRHWMELFVHGSWKLEEGAMFAQQNLPSALTIIPRTHSYILKNFISFHLASFIYLTASCLIHFPPVFPLVCPPVW